MKRWTAILILAAAGTLRAGDWEQHRRDAAGSGATPETVPPNSSGPALTPLWNLQLPSVEARSAPIVVGGRLYVGSEDGALRCLDLSTGAELWSFTAGGPVRNGPAYFRGRLYFGTSAGTLYCLHAGTGETLWSLFHGGRQLGSVLAATIPGPTDAIFFGVGDPSSEVRAYRADTGAFLWARATGQPISGRPVLHLGSTPKVVVGNNVGRWQAFDAATGNPLWSVQADSASLCVSATVDGDRLLYCGGAGDRKLHVLDVETGAQIKEVLGVPPAFAKAGGGPDGQVVPFLPESLLSPDTLHNLLNTLDKAARDEEVDAWAALRGFDATLMKQWLDGQIAPASPSPNQKAAKSGSPFFVNFSRGVSAGSLAAADGKAYGTHRERSGNNNDEYFTWAADVTPGVAGWPAKSSNLWGSAPMTQSWMDGRIMPSPVLSGGRYLYYAHTRTVHILDVTSFTPAGSVDAGDYILHLVAANGRIVVTTLGGRVKAYASGNTPPSAPTAFSPAGGANVTSDAPTLAWSGQSDPETAAASLTGLLEFGYGWPNADLEISTNKVQVTVPGGLSSYAFAALPANTHVFWRVRVQDPMGAMSGWSPIQDFWANRDTTPPDPPAALTATAGDGQVALSWSPSPSADVERYRLRYKEASKSWAAATLVDSLYGTSTTIAGLTNDLVYDFSLTAVDFGENESAAMLASTAPVAPITLGGSGPGFATIQLALDAALPGQTVVLQPGTFVESVILRPGVSLAGAGASRTLIRGGGAAVVIRIQGSYGVDPPSRVSALTVTDGGTGIDAQGAEVSVDHVVVHGVTATAIAGSTGGRLHVENCTLTDNGGDGVSAGGLTSVTSSIIDRNGGAGVRGSASVSYTTLAANGSGESTGEPADYVDAAYHERDGSATVDGGDPALEWVLEPAPNGSRINQGAYGNTKEAALSATPGTPPEAGSGPTAGDDNSGRCSLAGGSTGGALPGLAVVLMLAIAMGSARRPV